MQHHDQDLAYDEAEFYSQFETWQDLYHFTEIAAYQAKQQDLKSALQARLQGVPDLKMTHSEYRTLEHEYSQLVTYFDPNPENLNDEERAIYFTYWKTCRRCHRIWSNEPQAEACCSGGPKACENCEYERIAMLVTQHV